MENYRKKKLEFVKLYLSGNYTQREIATMLDLTEQTISKWVKTEIRPLPYFDIRKELTAELKRITKLKSYETNSSLISQLIGDIERIERLIIKTKYIPPLTRQ